MSVRLSLVIGLAALVSLSSSAGAQVLSEKNISIKMALVIAETALNECTPRVSVAVLDRAGRMRVFLQGDGASVPVDLCRVGETDRRRRHNRSTQSYGCHSARRRRSDHDR